MISSSRTEGTNYLFNIDFLQVDPADTSKQSVVSFTDIPMEKYSTFIRPTKEQIELLTEKTKENSIFCGYRALPYAYLDKTIQSKAFDSFYGIQFDISWEKQSYIGGGDFDYTELKKSINPLKENEGFLGPEPYQKVY